MFSVARFRFVLRQPLFSLHSIARFPRPWPAPRLLGLRTCHSAAEPEQRRAESQEQSQQQSQEQKKANSPTKPRLSVLDKVQQEIRYANEYLSKFSGPKRERKRVSEDIEATKQRWAQEHPSQRMARAKAQEPGESKEVDLEAMTAAEREAYEAAEAKAQEERDRINATPLMNVETTETEWDKRLSSAKEAWKKTWLMRNIRKIKRNVMTTENPVVASIRDTKEGISDGLEDIKDFYGTTQHPVVARARDVVDNVTGVTETGWAIGEIRRVDPGFEIPLFLEDMEDYMIPLVTESFLRGDMAVLRSVTEENAARVVFASCREREVQALHWDPRILNVDHIEFQGATVENDVPYITLTFVCQHVHCIKDAKGKIVEGHETEVKSVYYIWKVRRDLENPDFDWKIVDLQLQRVYSLVG